MRLARGYRQDTCAFSGSETGGDFHVLGIDAEAGTVTRADPLGAFDAVKVATCYSARGLSFEYAAQSWVEGLWMSRRSNPGHPRPR